jgi:hypothetical protein
MSAVDGDSPYLAAISEVAAATPAPHQSAAPRFGFLRSFVSRLLVGVDSDAATVDDTGTATQVPLSLYDEREPAHPTKIPPGRNVTGGSSSAPPTTSRTGETR